MRIPREFLHLLSLLQVTRALYVGKFCPSACDFTIGYATFNDTDSWLSRQVRLCRSRLRITSLYLCFDQYCAIDGSVETWIEEQRPWCNEHAGVRLPDLRDVVDRWTEHDVASIRRLDENDFKLSPPLNEVILPEARFFNRAFTTMDVAFRQYSLHLTYGWYIYYFWIVVVTFGASTRILSMISRFDHRRKYSTYSTNHVESLKIRQLSILRRPKAWVKCHISVPATFGKRCSQPYGCCTIPPRIQSLTIFVFAMLNVVLCICSYQLTDGNLYWPEKSAQLTRYISDRTGILSLANFPLVWTFAMRNNMLMWITGWEFGTYNAFHRWVARIATVQAIIHSVGYTLMILRSGGWPIFREYLAQHYFWNGELATIAMCALLPFSLYGIRRSHYEIFLVTHIALSIVALWTMYFHVELFTKGEWNIFIWPCLCIWILDRIVRLGRVVAFNRQFWNTQATISYESSSNLVRMDVDGSKSLLALRPGTYYYIHVLNDPIYAHQSHPFTLVHVSSDTTKTPSARVLPLSSRPSPHRTSSDESTESDTLLAPNNKTTPSNLIFLIRPYDGFTSRLKSHCLLHPKRLRVLIEGPYGHAEPFHHFPHVLFIVGGAGIAVALSYISRLPSSTPHTQSTKIIWAVREPAFLASILRDFAGLLGDERVEMQVHVTQGGEVESEVLRQEGKSVRIATERPDVCGAVAQAAGIAGQSGLAVVACGPASMADQVRKASVEMLARGHGGVEYFEESFQW